MTKGKRPVGGRGPEYELIELFQALDSTLFGQRGKCSDGVDVLFCQAVTVTHAVPPYDEQSCAYVWRFEVKSSKARSQSLKDTAAMWEQYRNYLSVLKQYRIMTFYAFRLKHKVVRGEDPIAKWRIFRVDRLPKGKNGTPKLTLDTRTGWTIPEFVDKVMRTA